MIMATLASQTYIMLNYRQAHPRSLNQQDRSNSAPNVCVNMVRHLTDHGRKNNQVIYIHIYKYYSLDNSNTDIVVSVVVFLMLDV